MLTITERAKATLAQLKEQARIDDADIGLRLSLAASEEPGQSTFGLRADREVLGDQVIEYGGSKVLLVEEALADALADATIDAESSGTGEADLIISRSAQIEPGNENGGASR